MPLVTEQDKRGNLHGAWYGVAESLRAVAEAGTQVRRASPARVQGSLAADTGVCPVCRA